MVTFLSIVFIRREKQSVKELVLVMWVQTEERKVEDIKDEFEVGMKLKMGIFAVGRMKKIQMVGILHRQKAWRMKRA